MVLVAFRPLPFLAAILEITGQEDRELQSILVRDHLPENLEAFFVMEVLTLNHRVLNHTLVDLVRQKLVNVLEIKLVIFVPRMTRMEPELVADALQELLDVYELCF